MSGDGTVVVDRQAIAALVTSKAFAADLLRRGVRVQAAARRSLKQPGRGRVYQLSNPKRTHQASTPGEPPATDLGHLAASVTLSPGKDGQGLFVDIGTSLKKGRYLELGTRRIKPRPFLRTALAAAADKAATNE